MSKKILLSNGCSWVNGAGLSNREIQRWSYHLSKKLNMEDINISSEGASNDKILRTTIEWLKENKDKFSDVLVVIGWTQMTRTEFFNDVIGKWESQNFVSFGDSETDKESESFYEEQSKHMVRQASDYTPNDLWWKVYLKYYFSMEQRYNSFFNSVLYSQSIFKSFGIDYIYFASFGKRLQKILSHDLIDEKHILQDNMVLIDVIDDSGHPDIESHKNWADYLYEEIKKRKYVN
jgi:hypothetical protein